MTMAKSATLQLSGFYGLFFLGGAAVTAQLVVAPYMLALTAFVERKKAGEAKGEQLDVEEVGNFVGGIALCIALSTIVPVLPAITSFTLAAVSLTASLALASMFVTYPLAILSDLLGVALDSPQYSLSMYP